MTKEEKISNSVFDSKRASFYKMNKNYMVLNE